MSPIEIFRTQLGMSVLASGLFVAVYWWPILMASGPRKAFRQIAMLHAFRFEGLLFLMPAFVGTGLPAAFAVPAAYGDLATSVLAVISIVAFRWEVVALAFTVIYTTVGAIDLVGNVYRLIALGIGEHPERLGIAYLIPILYVPLLLITHGVTVWLLLQHVRPRARAGGPVRSSGLHTPHAA